MPVSSSCVIISLLIFPVNCHIHLFSHSSFSSLCLVSKCHHSCVCVQISSPHVSIFCHLCACVFVCVCVQRAVNTLLRHAEKVIHHFHACKACSLIIYCTVLKCTNGAWVNHIPIYKSLSVATHRD